MRSLRLGLMLALPISLAGCATSRIENAWVEPSATPKSFALNQVLVTALVSDGAIRRATEDAMDRALSAGPRGQSGQLVAHPSYTLLEDRELVDAAAARKKVEAAGYDGAVLIRFVSSHQEVNVTPPSYSGGYWGHYGYGGGVVMYDPGTVRTDTILKLQINIYSLAEGKLLWSGVSRTLNPSKIEKLVGDVANAVREDLSDRGLAP
jgi:hypothetical protein